VIFNDFRSDFMFKRCVAIHDISAYGKCSLTVVMPVVSAMGVEVCPIPTALLSTHTSGFSGFTFNDLTKDVGDILNHWRELDMNVDCIYSGFLGSDKQIKQVADYIHTFPGAYIAIDPVMGDNGAVYKTYTKAMCDGMKSLVAKADLIIPNLTEAAILLDEEYPKSGTLCEEDAKKWLNRLQMMGAKSVVLSGLINDDGDIVNAGLDDNFFFVKSKRIEGNFHGTGDLFSSVMVGSLMQGKSFEKSLEKSTEFAYLCCKKAKELGIKPNLGVPFELLTKELIKD